MKKNDLIIIMLFTALLFFGLAESIKFEKCQEKLRIANSIIRTLQDYPRLTTKPHMRKGAKNER